MERYLSPNVRKGDREVPPVVSIVVPAFDSPAMLDRCLRSIFAQSYQAIEVVVVDDNSPSDLRSVVNNLPPEAKAKVSFFRNTENLKPYWNLEKGWGLAHGKYVLFMPHDDHFVADNFISRGVSSLRASATSCVFIGNSFNEATGENMMKGSGLGLQVFAGEYFVTNMLFADYHPAYSAVLLDNEKLWQKNYGSFFLNRAELLASDIHPDELFVSIVLAALDNTVLVTEEVFSVRGDPLDSYSKSEFWQTRGHLGVFLVCWHMLRYAVSKRRLSLSFFYLKLAAGMYGPGTFNLSLLRHTNYSPAVALVMLVSVLHRAVRKLLR